jgi:NNP family nitrate/nitrite transporter-like MFS transporter
MVSRESKFIIRSIELTFWLGIVSGCTGAAGNLGGIVFAIIFRYNGTNYSKVFWIIGIITICINLALSWIRPIPKGQIGGH